MSEPDAHLVSPLLLACRDLARAMDQFDEAACATLGLGRSDLRALNLLEHGPMSPSQLAQRLALSRPAVTALIDRLAGAGYVSRVRVPGDRRASAVELRSTTWHALARVYRPLGEQVSQVESGLTDAERRSLAESMTRMTTAFDDSRVHLPAVSGPDRPDRRGAAE